MLVSRGRLEKGCKIVGKLLQTLVPNYYYYYNFESGWRKELSQKHMQASLVSHGTFKRRSFSLEITVFVLRWNFLVDCSTHNNCVLVKPFQRFAMKWNITQRG